jgi:hypothetical protein
VPASVDDEPSLVPPNPSARIDPPSTGGFVPMSEALHPIVKAKRQSTAQMHRILAM